MQHNIITRPIDPELRRIYDQVVYRKLYIKIHDYAVALIQLVHHRDDDGRAIGYDYEHIHRLILSKFPRVTFGGPHKGNRTKMPFKELVEIACELNRNGVRLPFRPRRRADRKNKKKSGEGKA